MSGEVDALEALRSFQGLSAGAQGIWLFGSLITGGWLLKALAEWRAWRKLSLEERQANREGFTAQVAVLRDLLAEALARLGKLQDRYDKLQLDHDEYRALCRAETDQLRQQIVQLENDLSALHRRRSATSVALVHDLTPEKAPEAAASAARTAGHLARRAKEG